jgi:predicted ATPase
MGQKLDKLSIEGFKSIKSLKDFALGDLNVLIGANGAGKSNFVEFFRLLRAIVDENLQAYMLSNAPADGHFHHGVKKTKRIRSEMFFGENRNTFELMPAADGSVVLADEQTQFLPSEYSRILTRRGRESILERSKDDPGVLGRRGPNWYVWESVSQWQVYHFHDTTMTAGMRRDSGVEQTNRLDWDGGNLAAFLRGMRESAEDQYRFIRTTIQRIAPYFDDFDLKARNGRNEDQVRLTWKQKGTKYIFSPGHLSDGTIRFVCLITALLQPSPPRTIVIDEPELGLHPEALAILAGIMHSVSADIQIIVATQSPILLSEFPPDSVITVDQDKGATQFKRLGAKKLKAWLADFSLGELWMKGNIRGGVNHA